MNEEQLLKSGERINQLCGCCEADRSEIATMTSMNVFEEKFFQIIVDESYKSNQERLKSRDSADPKQKAWQISWNIANDVFEPFKEEVELGDGIYKWQWRESIRTVTGP